MNVRLCASVTVPDLRVSSDVVEFGEVKCGECRIVSIQLHNHQAVRCDWSAAPAEHTKKQVIELSIGIAVECKPIMSDEVQLLESTSSVIVKVMCVRLTSICRCIYAESFDLKSRRQVHSKSFLRRERSSHHRDKTFKSSLCRQKRF